MSKYRKKQALVEAVQFDPEQRPWHECIHPWPDGYGVVPRDMSWGYIATLEGIMHVMADDWIVTNERDTFPIRPDIFEKCYEAIE